MTELPARTCRERVAGAGVGRVAWCGNGRPQITPVNYTMHGDDIVFRTSPYSGLGRHIAGAAVAFEVDGYDEDQRSGWSVVVHAQASVVDDPDEAMKLRRLGPQPWAPGQRNLFVRLRTDRITGRQVGQAP